MQGGPWKTEWPGEAPSEESLTSVRGRVSSSTVRQGEDGRIRLPAR